LAILTVRAHLIEKSGNILFI